ncbi:WD40-repeat-containing domain protein [Pelagophyceae sp. CCMP2097]|nr:WD40-repeat-containing domain protein [Pelagophyceae sp. CCMP2097]
MKIKAVARSERTETRQSTAEKMVERRNLDPQHHPFAQAREYTRAVVAAKLDRMMAKPFVCALDAHADGITCLAAPRTGSTVQLVSGAADGEARVWDLAQRKCVWRAPAHVGAVRAAVLCPAADAFLTCGERCVRMWKLEVQGDDDAEPDAQETWTSAFGGINDVDVAWGSRTETAFATASTEGTVELWDAARTNPIRKWSWGSDAVLRVRWNPAEPAVLASSGRDRSLALYDARQAAPLRKTILTSRANGLAWNPREPGVIVVGCDDGNALTFDVRKLDKPRMIHTDHVHAILDVAFAPSGLEFATAGADRTTRIFPARGGGGRSRESYHAQRMQRVTCVAFTSDASFLVTGSDDANVRVWKAQASAKLGPVSGRERASLEYRATLLKRHQHMPVVRRIVKQRNLPKMVKKMKERQAEARDRERAKLNSTIDHSKPGAIQPVAARAKAVIRELD